ncbi:MAG: TlpA family protein disulfide reductase [Microthrixaceae bacterium]
MTPEATDPAPHTGNRRRTMLVAAGVALIAVIVGVVVALSGPSDKRDDGDTGSRTATPVFGPISVDGAPLEAFTSTEDDPARGGAAPVVAGQSADGAATTIGAPGEPTMVVFLAHWCPHCQRELPRIVELMADGELTGVRVVAVLTGSSADRPNFPPMAWLEREGWSGEVMLDSEASAAAQSFGLTSYPFLTFLDRDGTVAARASGELPAEDIVALAELIR